MGKSLSNYPNGFNNGALVREALVANPPRRNLYVGNNATKLENELTKKDDPNYGTFLKPFSTLDYAVGQAKAGDYLWVRPGHTETVTAAGGLDLDVAGITIVFLGEGNNRGYITFTTAVTADMDVDAADITLVNPRFVAGIDALTGPIDVNAARFHMYGATWQDGTSINTTDCVVADANADDMVIDAIEFIDGDAAGTQKQSFIQVAGATRPTIKSVKCTGDFGTGIIENGTAWVDAYLENLALDNASASPTVCILLQATSSGQARNCHLRVASGTTYVTANNDMQWFECYGTGTDATAGELIGTSLASDLEAKIDVIDGYMDVATANTSTNAVMRDVIGNKTDTAASGAVTTTDSMMAYVKQLVTELAVVDGYMDAAGANATSSTLVRTVVGNKSDTAAAGAVTTTDSVVAYLKQLVNLDDSVNKDGARYLAVTADLNSATWYSKAAHEILAVSGLNRIKIIPYCTESVLPAVASVTIALGTSVSTAAFLGATTASLIDTGEFWLGTTNTGISAQQSFSSIIDKITALDVGYTLANSNTTNGTIVFHCWWEPLQANASVAAGAGGALT